MNSLKKSKLLIVDDKPNNLLALNTILKDDYDLVECLNGFAAIAEVKKHNFAAILLDVQMPVLDGYETAKLLREQKNAGSTPIIFITAIDRSEALEHRGYVAGAVDYLFKPIDGDILRAKLKVFAQLQQQSETIKEQALQAKENEHLRESLKIRDDFLSMASHELKTPITPLTLQIQAFIDLIETGKFETTPRESLLQMLNTSYSQVERLNRTVDDLLDVSRFVTGKFELKKNNCYLGDIVAQVIQSFKEQIQAANVECTLEIQENVKGYWDHFRIEQVFLNLLTNALRYGNRKPIKVIVSKHEDFAQLAVTDQGIGIDQADQKRIFNRFERAASDRHYSGLGLGLFIAHQIIQQHQGTILVESNIDCGATFIVRVPT